MKKLIFGLAVAAIGAFPANAQENQKIFRLFKGDVSMGFAAPTGSTYNGGALFAMEPKFGVMDKLYLGLRIEAAVLFRVSGSYGYGYSEVDDAKATFSNIATADYYFTNNYSFRPFVGAGVGVFGIAEDNNEFDDDLVTATKFGGIIRTGFEVKHFRFGVEYNIIPVTDIFIYNNMGNAVREKSNNGYFGIKAGFCFGGGPL